LSVTTFNSPHGSPARLGAGFLIAVVHLCALLALVNTTFHRVQPDSGPVRFLTVTLLPPAAAPAPSKAVATDQVQAVARPPTISLPRVNVPAVVAAPAQRRVDTSAADPAPSPVEAPAAAPAPAPATRRIDMDAVRAAARQFERERVPTGIERVREAELFREKDDNDAARAIKKAERPDCRHAYGGGTKANIFALIPLAIDTLTDHGCKW
jgi:hypothetical protein